MLSRPNLEDGFLITVDVSSSKLNQSPSSYITFHIYWLCPLWDSQYSFSSCDDGKLVWKRFNILHHKRKAFDINYVPPQERYAEKQGLLQERNTDCSPEGDWAMVTSRLCFRLIEQKKEGEKSCSNKRESRFYIIKTSLCICWWFLQVLGKSGQSCSLFVWETCRRWPQTWSTVVVLCFWRKIKCCRLSWTLVEVKEDLCFCVHKTECESKGAAVLLITFFSPPRKINGKMPEIVSKSISKSYTEGMNSTNVP